MSIPVRTVMPQGGGLELTERITARVIELTSEAELLRMQLADAEHELGRLMIAGQVITQLTADDVLADAEPADSGTAGRRGFGLLVPPGSQASGPGDLRDNYRWLVEAVAAVAAETGRPRTSGPSSLPLPDRSQWPWTQSWLRPWGRHCH